MEAQFPAGIIGRIFVDLRFELIHIFYEFVADIFITAGIMQDRMERPLQVVGVSG